MLAKRIRKDYFALLLSCITLLFHYPFFKFVFNHLEYNTFSGILLIFSLFIAMIIANFFVYLLFLSISEIIGKILLVITFFINTIAVYFVNAYNVIIDESMIGNVFNTNYEESSAFFSIKLVLYVLILAIIPIFFIIKTKLIKISTKRTFATLGISLLTLLILAFINASNWLWIDKNSKQLGGLAMPWSYSVNTSLYYIHEAQRNKKEILLPNAVIKDQEKTVVVLVIGESARRENFSLYGYSKNTNPYLSKIPNVFHFDANSSATYTTAGVKAILDHKDTGDLYEILPNYLNRNNVDVIWRTTNWGEPPIHINKYEGRDLLEKKCEKNCEYDEVLLANLKADILASKKNKVLVVLHTSTSHGPSYNKKYPPEFEVFKPVCKSVELANCTKDELMNAYDNTIVYTDYILSKVIDDLKELKDYKSAMIFVSDHGESLGEKNLYMHGLPMSIAPKEQYEIPFIVWLSDRSKPLKPNKILSQYNVFHSVLDYLHIDSPIYNQEQSIFSK